MSAHAGAKVASTALLVFLVTACVSTTQGTPQMVADHTVPGTATATSTLTPVPAGTVTVSATVIQTQVQTVVSTVPPPAPAVAFTDGTYLVGREVQPGRYKADDADGEGCYWERLDAEGEIIDNAFEGTTLLIIRPTDYAITSAGCGNWALVN